MCRKIRKCYRSGRAPELHNMNNDNSFRHVNQDDACLSFSHNPNSIEVLIRNIALNEFIIDNLIYAK